MLHWSVRMHSTITGEYRYLWQEKKRYCPEYCLEASDKRSGATLEIKDCSRSPLQKFRTDDGGILRPAWSDSLCVNRDKLRKCNSHLSGLRTSGHFEIKYRNFCFSNPHHPKSCGEYDATKHLESLFPSSSLLETYPMIYPNPLCQFIIIY